MGRAEVPLVGLHRHGIDLQQRGVVVQVEVLAE